MPKCVFERATGLFLSGTRYDDVPHDPATQVQIELPDFPDRREKRWNGATGIRAATASEIAAYDETQKDTRATLEIDSPALRAVIRAVLDEIDGRHAANPVDRVAFRTRTLGYLKGLL